MFSGLYTSDIYTDINLAKEYHQQYSNQSLVESSKVSQRFLEVFRRLALLFVQRHGKKFKDIFRILMTRWFYPYRFWLPTSTTSQAIVTYSFHVFRMEIEI
jgi:hypothetical protein